MAENTQELYEKFIQRFPEQMTVRDISAELDRMNQQDAEEYDTILCYELFKGFCHNYLKYNLKVQENILQSEEYKIFKRRSSNLLNHVFFDAWCAFLEGRKKDVKTYIHEYIQTYEHVTPPYGEEDVAFELLLAFKNAYAGFWKFVKQEIEIIPHDEIAAKLCDIIEAFYDAPTNEEALEVLVTAYQKYPESTIINEMLGVVYFDEKQYGNAIAAFERLYSAKTDSYNSTLHTEDQMNFFLGYANDKLKDRKTAIDYYKKAVEISPRCPYAANNLGYLYYRERQYDKAYSILKRCIEERWETDLVFPVTNFARLLYAMGKYSEAREFVKNAPVKVAKAIRDKIEKAPEKDAITVIPEMTPDEIEENSEPVAKAVIERKGFQFQSEKMLEDELTMRMEAGIEVFGLPLKIYKRRGEYGRQFVFPKGRLDILAEDAEKNLYIIELKKDSGYDDVYKQTIEYIDWFQKHKAKGKKVYGIICLNAPSKPLIKAVRQDDRVKLFEYQISYSEVK